MNEALASSGVLVGTLGRSGFVKHYGMATRVANQHKSVPPRLLANRALAFQRQMAFVAGFGETGPFALGIRYWIFPIHLTS